MARDRPRRASSASRRRQSTGHPSSARTAWIQRPDRSDRGGAWAKDKKGGNGKWKMENGPNYGPIFHSPFSMSAALRLGFRPTLRLRALLAPPRRCDRLDILGGVTHRLGLAQ